MAVRLEANGFAIVVEFRFVAGDHERLIVLVGTAYAKLNIVPLAGAVAFELFGVTVLKELLDVVTLIKPPTFATLVSPTDNVGVALYNVIAP